MANWDEKREFSIIGSTDDEFNDYISWVEGCEDLKKIPKEKSPWFLLPFNRTDIPYISHLLDSVAPCVKCGSCCRLHKEIDLEDRDLIVISNHFGISESQCMKKYKIEQSKTRGKYLTFKIVGHPCPFLSDNKCSINQLKPKVCGEYPLREWDEHTIGMTLMNECKRKEKLKKAYISLICYIRASHFGHLSLKEDEDLSDPENVKKILDISYNLFRGKNGKDTLKNGN
jgi:Fe-S-cluster containining protein